MKNIYFKGLRVPSRYGNQTPDVVYSSGKCVHRRLPSDAIYQVTASFT